MSRADAVWTAVIAVAVVSGLRVGLLRLAGPLIAVVVGVGAVGFLTPTVVDASERLEHFSELFLAFVVVTFIVGFWAGRRGVALGRRVVGVVPGLGLLNHLLGGVAGAGLGLGAAWLGTAYLLQHSADARAFGKDSELGQELLGRVPPADVLTALHRFDDLPVISVVLPDDAPPAPRTADVGAAVVASASRSVVQVTTEPCGLSGTGTGWAARGDRVVTNAHVIAGEPNPRVRTADGRTLPATVTYVDRRHDVAVLAVPRLRLPPLTLGGDPAFGVPAVIIGHPRGGPLKVAPARVGRPRPGVRPDPLTGRRRQPGTWLTVRTVAQVRGGSSGSPVVDRRGHVVAMVWGGVRDGPYALVVRRRPIEAALRAPAQRVSTPCWD